MAYVHLLKHYDAENSYPNFDGVTGGATVSLWFNGCSKKCKGCWNMETWGRKKSLYMDNEDLIEETLVALDEHFPKQLALIGGDPLEESFEQDFRNNASDTLDILSKIRDRRPETRVICWTGYNWDECLELPVVRQILDDGLIDLLIVGRFEEDLKVEGGLYGSSNQELLDVVKSLESGVKVVVG